MHGIMSYQAMETEVIDANFYCCPFDYFACRTFLRIFLQLNCNRAIVSLGVAAPKLGSQFNTKG